MIYTQNFKWKIFFFFPPRLSLGDTKGLCIRNRREREKEKQNVFILFNLSGNGV